MKAAVVGCGIGGMAAALALSRKGWDVTLLEAFDAPRPLGSGLLLQPTGLAALRALGLEDQVRAVGARVERLEGRDTRGRRVLDLDYARWRPGGHGVGLHRASLFDLLHVAARASAVQVVIGARIERIETVARPVLHDAAGRAWGPFDLVIVADGSASSLRCLLRPRARARLNPWGAVWANAPDPEGRFAGALRQMYHRAEVMIGALPIGLTPGGTTPLVSLFWSLPVAEMDAFYAGDFEAWRARVGDLWPDVAPLFARLGGFGDLARATYRDVSVGRWSEGACLLIGDAAHGTSPQLGQGANLALLDAVELAERLAARTHPMPRTLTAYQASRRRHTALYQVASRALTPLFQSHGAAWATIRDLAFTPLSRLPGLRWIGALVLTGVARLGRWPKATRP